MLLSTRILSFSRGTAVALVRHLAAGHTTQFGSSMMLTSMVVIRTLSTETVSSFTVIALPSIAPILELFDHFHPFPVAIPANMC